MCFSFVLYGHGSIFLRRKYTYLFPDVWLLQHIIAALEGEGKAELMLGDSPDFSDAGVKFF